MRIKLKDCKEFFNRVSIKMFNLYQHIKSGDKEQKEPETTGHDRFYQERSRSSYRKKKRGACRRAQSAAELDPESVAAANKRNAFRIRSASTDKEESEGMCFRVPYFPSNLLMYWWWGTSCGVRPAP